MWKKFAFIIVFMVFMKTRFIFIFLEENPCEIYLSLVSSILRSAMISFAIIPHPSSCHPDKPFIGSTQIFLRISTPLPSISSFPLLRVREVPSFYSYLLAFQRTSQRNVLAAIIDRRGKGGHEGEVSPNGTRS